MIKTTLLMLASVCIFVAEAKPKPPHRPDRSKREKAELAAGILHAAGSTISLVDHALNGPSTVVVQQPATVIQQPAPIVVTPAPVVVQSGPVVVKKTIPRHDVRPAVVAHRSVVVAPSVPGEPILETVVVPPTYIPPPLHRREVIVIPPAPPPHW